MRKAIALVMAVLIALLMLSGCGTPTQMKNTVILETSMGVIELELNENQAPITTANFLSYVQSGFYDRTIFHRVIPGFMVQGGGFTPDGEQKQTKAPIILESGNGLRNDVGTIAMARTNVPDSATSQFFINLAQNDFLNKGPDVDGYAVFGKVVAGMDVINAIATSPTGTKSGNADWPVADIIIKKAYAK